MRCVGIPTDRAHAPGVRSAMSPQRDPDPDATISDAQAIQKAFTDFWAVVMAHDAFLAVAQVEDVRGTLDRVTQLQSWLEHYSEALRQRVP
jgi:hypothetical protein